MFHILSLLTMCTIMSFFMFFNVRSLHLNKDYLLTYLQRWRHTKELLQAKTHRQLLKMVFTSAATR